ncbi:MAG TPA: hypothetical protein V6C84_26340 [Coleofasciculaceae cyanobacterium]|jgi:hypothetical protein
MILVDLFFSKLESHNATEIVPYTDAHIAISQYKHGKPLWFDQVPRVGEMVYFESPRNGVPTFFQVTQVFYYPRELADIPSDSSSVRSRVSLSPVFPKWA